ncbi:phage terminase large subunit-like protein [Actinocrispum wychmicini]|uniref:Phage terminase large subunit-like protein n=1 Tax=Actinocrispum wychmicini TaxID=1213861 RepID=A0A4R2JWT9_9PSEU|nr:phage terminase large subunit-like protein [Actinocrispum wychmicini]
MYAHYGLTCPPRFATLRNVENPTLGPKVARISARLGAPFMPWQRYVFDTALEIDRYTGLFVYRDIGCTVPRQSGKTTGILSLATHRGLAWQRQKIVYAAQNGTAARQKWEDDQLPILAAAGYLPAEGEKLLPSHKGRVRKANGREAIIWRKTQSLFTLHANTERAGHGNTLHLAVADEYFAQVDYRISAAWSPAMITVPDAQQYWFSTMGTSKSVPMNEAVKAGREMVESGAHTRVAYFDWSAPHDSDRADPTAWLACMPALCPDLVCRCSPDWRHTVTIPIIETELTKATTPAQLAEFDRAYRNIVREDDEIETDPNVPTAAEWELLADAQAKAAGDAIAIAIDTTPMASHTAIVAVGDGPDGHPLVVLLKHGPGTSWVPAYCEELAKSLSPVAWILDAASRTGELIEPLKRAGIVRHAPDEKFPRGGLWIPTTQDVGAACGALTTRVRTGGLVHLGQPPMAAAVAGAKTRPLGDGAIAFGRKVSSADISPLCGTALALAAYLKFQHLAAVEDYDPLDNIW